MSDGGQSVTTIGRNSQYLAEVFQKFIGSSDYGPCPSKSFGNLAPERVESEDLMKNEDCRLLYHQVTNCLGYLGVFSNPDSMTASDQRVAMKLWPQLSPRQDGRCYFPDFVKVITILLQEGRSEAGTSRPPSASLASNSNMFTEKTANSNRTHSTRASSNASSQGYGNTASASHATVPAGTELDRHSEITGKGGSIVHNNVGSVAASSRHTNQVSQQDYDGESRRSNRKSTVAGSEHSAHSYQQSSRNTQLDKKSNHDDSQYEVSRMSSITPVGKVPPYVESDKVDNTQQVSIPSPSLLSHHVNGHRDELSSLRSESSNLLPARSTTNTRRSESKTQANLQLQQEIIAAKKETESLKAKLSQKERENGNLVSLRSRVASLERHDEENNRREQQLLKEKIRLSEEISSLKQSALLSGGEQSISPLDTMKHEEMERWRMEVERELRHKIKEELRVEATLASARSSRVTPMPPLSNHTSDFSERAAIPAAPITPSAFTMLPPVHPNTLSSIPSSLNITTPQSRRGSALGTPSALRSSSIGSQLINPNSTQLISYRPTSNHSPTAPVWEADSEEEVCFFIYLFYFMFFFYFNYHK